MGTIEHQGKAPSTDGTGQRPHTTPKPDKSDQDFCEAAL
jgi:hypothetical protein